MLRNTPHQFGLITVLLHWSMALVIYGMFALGLWMVGLGYYDNWYHDAPEIHKSIGVILLLILVVRLLWRVISPPPPPLSSYFPLVRIQFTGGALATLQPAAGHSGQRLPYFYR